MKIFPFKGSSMLPTIPYDCEIIATPLRNIEIGDIYIYLDEDIDSKTKLVCHRLIKLLDGNFLFKGDNRCIADKPISKDKILWKYEGWINANFTNRVD
ncbi:MAG: S26 family signal peptidase [Sulfurimonas sp.]